MRSFHIHRYTPEYHGRTETVTGPDPWRTNILFVTYWYRHCKICTKLKIRKVVTTK